MQLAEMLRTPILEPFDRDVRIFEGGVLHLGEGLGPVDPLRLLRPEAVRVIGTLPHRAVHIRIDMTRLGPFLGHRMKLQLRQSNSSPEPGAAVQPHYCDSINAEARDVISPSSIRLRQGRSAGPTGAHGPERADGDARQTTSTSSRVAAPIGRSLSRAWPGS